MHFNCSFTETFEAVESELQPAVEPASPDLLSPSSGTAEHLAQSAQPPPSRDRRTGLLTGALCGQQHANRNTKDLGSVTKPQEITSTQEQVEKFAKCELVLFCRTREYHELRCCTL